MTKELSAVERELDDLIRQMHGRIPETELREVLHFMEANELGLALETLCHILIQRSIECSEEVVSRVKAMAEAMEMDSSVWIELRDRFTVRSDGR